MRTSTSVMLIVASVLLTPGRLVAALKSHYTFDSGTITGSGMAGSPWVAADAQTPADNAGATGALGGANILPAVPGYLGDAVQFTNDPAGAAPVDFENVLATAAGTAPSGSSQRTLATWFYQKANVGQNKIFGYGDIISGTTFDVGLEGGGIRLRHFGGNITYGANLNFLAADKGWNHVAVRVNPGATDFNSVDVFLNGVQLVAQPGSALTVTLNTTDSPFGIGNTSVTGVGAGTSGFTGLLDDFRIYDTAITTTDIQALANAPANPSLKLLVNRDTGQVTLSRSGTTLTTLGYRLLSPAGGLDFSRWQSIAGNYDAPTGGGGNGSVDPDDDWTILSPQGSSTSLAEAELEGGNGGALANAHVVNLTKTGGGLWRKSPFEDLDLELLLANGSIVNATVLYEGNGGQAFKLGDLDFNNAINGVDWALFRGNLFRRYVTTGVANYASGDLDGDGDTDASDFSAFKAAYDTANGVGSFAAIPEPSTRGLAASSLLFLLSATYIRKIRGKSHMALHRCGRASIPVAALLAVCLTTSSESHAAQVLRYTFDDGDFSGAGTAGNPWVLNDVAAPATNATASGTLGGTNITPSQPGAFGKAWRFATDSTGAAAADFENLMVVPAGIVPSGSAERTISMWFNQTLDTPQQDKLFGYGGSTAGAAFDISLEGGIRLRHFGGNILYSTGSTFFPGGTNPGWNHLALRVNPGATTFANVDVFLNGAPLGAGTGATTAVINTTNSTFGIGTSTITASGTIAQGFTGLLDEFRVYDNALTNADIAQLAVPPLLTLTLEVQTDTGRAFIRNNSAQPYDVDFYSVRSADLTNGSLIPANLNPLQTMNLSEFPGGNGSGNGWEVGGGSSETELGEAYLTGMSTFAPGMTPLGIGNIFDVADAQDLSFSYRSSGSVVTGQVIYTTAGAGVAADYNRSGVVEAADLAVWKENFGSRNILMNDTSPGTVDGADFLLWQRRLGATSSVPATAAVPEPTTGALLMAGGLLAACVRARRRLRRSSRVRIVVAGACCLAAVHATASTNDRIYQFGEGSGENGVAGAVVGSGNGFGNTFDDTGPSGGGFVDLAPINSPVYLSTAATSPNLLVPRPGAGVGELGISFDGVNQYLTGFNLNRPSQSVSSSQFATPGPFDYVGINDRGFQLWVYPNAAASGVAQTVVADSVQHGLSVSTGTTPTWLMNYGGTTTNSGAAVAFNQWSHLMVVRPSGTTSVLYVNGVAVATDTRTYADSNNPLVVGANSGAAPGSSGHFRGVVDEMKMFVMGTSTSAMPASFGAFNFRVDNDFAASALTSVAGDISGAGGSPDGVLNGLDINAFIAGWESIKRVNGVQVGDVATYKKGDLNFDGVTDLRDVFLMHGALAAANLNGLANSLLAGQPVPEPRAMAMLTGASILLALIKARRRDAA